MQPPPADPAGLPGRAFTPIQNPVYIYNDDDSFKTKPTPHNVLEQPARPGVDPRLTSQGSLPPVAGLAPYIPYAPQTPMNVWEYPA